ncbi:MAG: tetratricopeptide repeat protein [Candidatus Thiodiazotropha sp. (ex Myrtea sp. 'scaly one' KF741663)]|nr:tetratricopeptide repeat protein [Candidatus Thiodiazotropha sp. (ex Myrtea sp. 'scaly one' KF741663)]
MSAYQTEEEQVEALKRWWKENGTSIIAGLVIGLGGVFGWQAWGNYEDRIGKDASQSFNQMLSAVQRGDTESSSKQAELLRLEYDSSNYAVFAALTQARLKLEQGDGAAARSQLEWAIGQTDEPSLKALAQLNLARILLSEGDLDGAAKLTDVETGGFAGEFAMLRGDIAAERGDKQAAHDAYTQAMTLEVSNRNLLQMKLDDLALANP